MSSKRTATRKDILFAGLPPGYRLVDDFCEAVEAGRPPDPDTLQNMAKAFRVFQKVEKQKDRNKALCAFAEALGLHSKASVNTGPTAAEVDHRVAACVQYRLLKESGKPEGVAADMIAAEFETTPGSLRRWNRDHASEVQTIQDWIAAADSKWGAIRRAIEIRRENEEG